MPMLRTPRKKQMIKVPSILKMLTRSLYYGKTNDYNTI